MVGSSAQAHVFVWILPEVWRSTSSQTDVVATPVMPAVQRWHRSNDGSWAAGTLNHHKGPLVIQHGQRRSSTCRLNLSTGIAIFHCQIAAGSTQRHGFPAIEFGWKSTTPLRLKRCGCPLKDPQFLSGSLPEMISLVHVDAWGIIPK